MKLQMFAEEAVAAEAVETPKETKTEEKPQPKVYTDEEVDKLIERKQAEWQKKQDKERKKAEEAKKLQEMNDQQKAEYELKQLKDELAALKHKDAQAEMLKIARGILADQDIYVSDELTSLLISDDAEQTNATVNEFAELFRGEVNAAVKEALKGDTPKKGNPAPSMTKEQIMAVKNPTERQKLIKEHMDLFQ